MRNVVVCLMFMLGCMTGLSGTLTAEQASQLVYVAGTVGSDAATGKLPAGVGEQVRRAMENIRGELAEHGLELSDVASVNVFLSDTRHFQTMNAVYRTYFPVDPPARATVEAEIAVPGALVQIAMVAVRSEAGRTAITPVGMRRPGLPYSWGILAGNTLFLAGTTSRDLATYQPVTGDIATQTRRVLENIGATLEAAHMDYRNVAACKVFLADSRDFDAMNEVYREFFPESAPARATVEVGLMNPAFKVEIQCIAEGVGTKKVVLADGASLPQSPYSPAIEVGGRMYLSGMVGRGPDGWGNLKQQTRWALQNLQRTLKAGNMGLEDVGNVYVFVSDIRRAQQANEVIAQVMPSPGVAITMVEAELVAPDGLIEIMMTANH
ncbi:MAG: RidA family protein [Gemmatimonadales bacterium]